MLRQGDAMLPILINLAFEKVVREVTLYTEGVKIGKYNIEILAYEDDIVLRTEGKDKLKKQ